MKSILFLLSLFSVITLVNLYKVGDKLEEISDTLDTLATSEDLVEFKTDIIDAIREAVDEQVS